MRITDKRIILARGGGGGGGGGGGVGWGGWRVERLVISGFG